MNGSITVPTQMRGYLGSAHIKQDRIKQITWSWLIYILKSKSSDLEVKCLNYSKCLIFSFYFYFSAFWEINALY